MSSKPGVGKSGWAGRGYTEVKPTDPSANQSDADIMMEHSKPTRQQTDKDRCYRAEEMQRGDIKPMVSRKT